MGGPSDTDIIDFSPDDGQDTGREVDAETPVSAAAVAFNNAALPPHLPEWLKDAIRADAAHIVQAMQEDDVRLTDAKLRQDGDQDNLDALWQIVADRERREREWDQSRVAIGGVTMSGQEWDDAYEFLSDPKMRGKLVQAMTRLKGWSQDRAEKAANDALTLAQIAQRKKDGTITLADEAKAGEITRRNPDAVEMVKEAARMKNDRGYGASLTGSSMEGAALGAAKNSTSVGTAEIAAAPTDETFKGAPDLVSQFDAARLIPTVKPAPSPNVQIASINPSLDLNATF